MFWISTDTALVVITTLLLIWFVNKMILMPIWRVISYNIILFARYYFLVKAKVVNKNGDLIGRYAVEAKAKKALLKANSRTVNANRERTSQRQKSQSARGARIDYDTPAYLRRGFSIK